MHLAEVLDESPPQTPVLREHTRVHGDAPVGPTDWDAVAPAVCPGLARLASAGHQGRSLYRQCGLTPASGLTEDEFVAAGGSILTVGILKTKPWLAERSDVATADRLIRPLLARWRYAQWDLGSKVRLPASRSGRPVPPGPVVVRVDHSGVAVGGEKLARLDHPDASEILRDALNRAGHGRAVVVAASRDLEAAVLSIIRAGVGGEAADPIDVLTMVDDIDDPFRVVALADIVDVEGKTVQDMVDARSPADPTPR